ncbi:ABC transporter substrate-binding protein [Gryllotalpicola protaetiae]|uniref:Carbohydrate ABC transporter substrate-binding protein n=1 Tax=Gryllotalpicola protaetiae TaxID=2419771 RepID=A0A387BNU5_9MICO|nr:ABC transporter substrate-binding protein [Gryllotalpicola protaetiae]AYG04132.1 carbohydrate ABC transporter substrate-binding protein [Gryllotalpicola protaetiae]
MSIRSYARRARIRAISAAAIAGIALIAVAGCSSGGAASTSTGSATKGNITWWGWSPEPGSATEYIKAFNKVYPDIHVTFKQLQIAGYDAGLRPALASKVGPDVFDVAPGGGIGSVEEYYQNASDLAPAVQKSLGSDWKSKVAPIGIDSLTVKGKLTGLSVGSTFAGNLWINQDIFDKYHLTPPTTLDEWADVCKALATQKQGCFVQGAGQVAFDQDTLQSIADSVKPGVWTAASKGDAKWTDPTIVQALTIWKKMFSNGIMNEGALGLQQYPDANNAFLSGKYAMVMMGTWYMQYATESGATAAVSAAGVANAKPFNMISIPFPDVAGNGNPPSMYGDSDYGLAVNAKSNNQAAAKTFVTWITTSKAGQQVVGNVLTDIPSLNGVQPDWSNVELVDQGSQQSNLQNLIKTTTTVKEPRLSLVSSQLQQAIGVAATSVAQGSASPQQAAATLQSTAGGK